MPTPWNDATKYLRIVAISIYAYDWVLTAPAEIRLYRRQAKSRKVSSAGILLFLVRYLGAFALISNVVAFLSRFWTMEACSNYYRVMMVIQCLASWASHAVFVVRTMALCGYHKPTTISLIALGCLTSGLELFAQLYSFRRYDVGSGGNCLIQYEDAVNISWLYYMVSTLFDIVIIILTYRSLSLEHSLKYRERSSRKSSSSFTGVLWSSSIIYFSVTTVFNIANLVLFSIYNNSNATVLNPMGIAITSMMSGRVILNLHDYVHGNPISFNITNVRTVEPSTEEFSRSHTDTYDNDRLTVLDAKDFEIVERPRSALIGNNGAREHQAPWEIQWQNYHNNTGNDHIRSGGDAV